MSDKKGMGLLGPVGRELLENRTRPVGGRIPKNEFEEWEKFKSRCCIAGLQLSPDGFLDMLRTYNRINDVVFPIASVYNFKPIDLKNDLLEIMLNEINNISESVWKKDSTKVKENITNKLREVVKVSIE